MCFTHHSPLCPAAVPANGEVLLLPAHAPPVAIPGATFSRPSYSMKMPAMRALAMWKYDFESCTACSMHSWNILQNNTKECERKIVMIHQRRRGHEDCLSYVGLCTHRAYLTRTSVVRLTAYPAVRGGLRSLSRIKYNTAFKCDLN